MGIIEKGINGPFKGKAGSVIGSSWKKINYIKGLHRKNKRPPSAEQAIQQQKFKLLTEFFRPLGRALDTGFMQFTGKATGANAAFSYNHDHAFSIDGDNITLNYPALQLSHGSLYTAGAEKAWIEGDGVRISWDPKTYGMGGEMDDIAFAFVYSPVKDRFFSNGRLSIRHDGTAFVEDIRPLPDHELHVWLFFANKQQTRVSNSVYIPLAGHGQA